MEMCSYDNSAQGEARASKAELLAQDALLQAVAWVEQHPHGDGLVREHFPLLYIADLVVIGHRRDRTLVALEYLDDHVCGVGEQGAAPAPRPERAERGQRPPGG